MQWLSKLTEAHKHWRKEMSGHIWPLTVAFISCCLPSSELNYKVHKNSCHEPPTSSLYKQKYPIYKIWSREAVSCGEDSNERVHMLLFSSKSTMPKWLSWWAGCNMFVCDVQLDFQGLSQAPRKQVCSLHLFHHQEWIMHQDGLPSLWPGWSHLLPSI